jgi:ribosomal protein S18 acetylase RimI-like enzyme
VRIRPVEAHEVAALSALASRVYAETFGASMSRADLEAQLKATRSEEYFERALRDDTILVALLDEAIVGYVQLSDVRIPIEGAQESDQELFALYVRSDLHRRGIGTALLNSAFAQRRFATARRLYLDVWDENAGAIALYTKHGFGRIGRRDFAVDGRVVGSDIVMMREAGTS